MVTKQKGTDMKQLILIAALMLTFGQTQAERG
jgi:hypothetical protein